jgi:hypothetical protein
MRYDTSANYKEGFLSEEELLSMPLIKFFPALPPAAAAATTNNGDAPVSEQARQGVTYTGAPNARALLDFISEHAPASSIAPLRNKGQVVAELELMAPVTDAALRVASQKRLRSDPVFHLYEGSPCGKEMMGWMGHMLLSPYLSTPVPPEQQQKLFTDFQQCMRTKDEQMRKYWQVLAEVAADNLAKYDAKSGQRLAHEHEQQQQQGQEESDEDDEQQRAKDTVAAAAEAIKQQH